ncbi:MAG: hypothetical protein OEN56_03230 [Gemmatimonadota bacterium]|nr:hypothetical protein [Gemmatimonadota bacterium]
MRHEPGLKEDAKNLSVVAGSAALAALLTIGFIAARTTAEPIRDIRPVVVEVEVQPVVMEPVAKVEPAPRAPLTGIDRIYGTVTTVHGTEFTGFIRWDRNEGSWTDLLDALKPRHRGGSSISGIRFGHVAHLEVLDRDAALLTLRNGEQIELNGNASDLGSGLRALIVTEADGSQAEFEWRDLQTIDFESAGSTSPLEQRLHGTVTTQSGLEFTGYVTWDVDEIYSTDVLDGDSDGTRMEIRFGDIASIERYASWGSRVTLSDGRTYVLEGTNDVDASISGIEVSDATLGSVKLDWRSFDKVRFHEPSGDVSDANFDGGSTIRGTVISLDGYQREGEIVWDDDERFTWEMLNGELDGIEFHIEFGNIYHIERVGDGAVVTLRDGRSFELSNSNDVDRGNRGITIRTDGRDYDVRWSDFAEAVFPR